MKKNFIRYLKGKFWWMKNIKNAVKQQETHTELYLLHYILVVALLCAFGKRLFSINVGLYFNLKPVVVTSFLSST